MVSTVDADGSDHTFGSGLSSSCFEEEKTVTCINHQVHEMKVQEQKKKIGSGVSIQSWLFGAVQLSKKRKIKGICIGK